MAVEPSTSPWKCSPVPCESPCPRAIHAVTVELPGPPHLLPWAVPTGVDPPKPDRDCRTGCREGRSGAACLYSSVSFPLLVLSLVVYQLWPEGTWVAQPPLRKVSSPSAEGTVIWPRQWPWCPPLACGVRAHAPHVCHVRVSTVCLLWHPACLGWFV